MKKDNLDKNPMKQFAIWFEEANQANIYQPEAMTLTTVSPNGRPSARIVFLKEFVDDSFVFYTNYESRKGKELEENPHAALVFFWPELHRQVRIEGEVKKISKEKSQAYFKSRPKENQISAWASEQSSEIASRTELKKKFQYYQNKFKNKSVDCPPFWGGFCLSPDLIEFWQGRENRRHDRFLYKREKKCWLIHRLSP